MLGKNIQPLFLLLCLLLVALAVSLNTARAESADCIESHRDYDAEKCEAEDPVAALKLTQKEKQQKKQQKEQQEAQQQKPQEKSRKKIWNDDRGCNCPEPAKELEREDPLLRWKRMQCERACRE